MFKKLWIVALIYFASGAVLFGPFTSNPFLMDDEIQITSNPHIQNLSEWAQFFTSSTMDSGGAKQMGGIYYKPLMTTFFAVVWSIFPDEPAAYRWSLLLLHTSSALLLFLFLSTYFSAASSFWLGLLFLVHPINSETVAYIADAQDVLYLFFGLLTLWSASRLRRSWLLFICTTILFSLSLLSKETGALFLFVVPFFLFLFQKEKFSIVSLSAGLVAIFYLWVRTAVHLTHLENAVLHITHATIIERLLTLPNILWHYIETFFFPFRISLVTDFVVHSTGLFEFWLPLLGTSTFIGLLIGFRFLLKTQRHIQWYLFAVGCLLAWFALHSNLIVPLDGTYADRWFYLANLPFSILILLLLERTSWTLPPKIAGIALIGLSCGFAARTWIRLEDWANPIELYEREFALHPWDAIMANNVGVELFRRGDVAPSEPYFQQATELNPLWDVAWNNWGAVAEREGKKDKALTLYEKAISLGTYSLAYENYATLLLATGQQQKCSQFLEKALAIFPENKKLNEISKVLVQ
jgi:tetratricopeptide (TPR) repeat protein